MVVLNLEPPPGVISFQWSCVQGDSAAWETREEVKGFSSPLTNLCNLVRKLPIPISEKTEIGCLKGRKNWV
jgi:hypothetical protein